MFVCSCILHRELAVQPTLPLLTACEEKLAREGPRAKKAAGGRPKKVKPIPGVTAVNTTNGQKSYELAKMLSGNTAGLQGLRLV